MRDEIRSWSKRLTVAILGSASYIPVTLCSMDDDMGRSATFSGRFLARQHAATSAGP
jgi:hypothetical protein